MIDKDWLEFKKLKKRNFERDSWIPLRSLYKPVSLGKYGYIGYEEDLFYCTSVAFSSEQIQEAKKLSWDDLGFSKQHSSHIEKGIYYPSDKYKIWNNEKLIGTHLVIDQSLTSDKSREWHLNVDLVMALKLIKEGNSWFSPNDGYEEVVRIKFENNNPILIEIRSTYLKDYLCARNMDLVISSYRSRSVTTENKKIANWKNDYIKEVGEDYIFIGKEFNIHEGGEIFEGKVSVLHIERTDIDAEEDVPLLASLPKDENLKTTSFVRKFDGKKLAVSRGDFWRTEVYSKGNLSMRVRGDEDPEVYNFIIEASGEKESLFKLNESGRWLWFKPEIMMILAHRRGGSLEWYTAETGGIASSHGSCPVHFGINKLGYINIYAKDLSYLWPWEKNIWVSYNISPDGGVSDELQDSQVLAKPAQTHAPERFLPLVLKELNQVTHAKFGFEIIRHHEDFQEILSKTHRFRAGDRSGLFSLAKDLARLTADSFNIGEVQKMLASTPDIKKLGSLKLIEKLIATKLSKEEAHLVMGPLVGAYELRLGDAHLAGSKIQEAFGLVDIDPSTPFIFQGRNMLSACVTSLYQILKVFKNWEK